MRGSETLMGNGRAAWRAMGESVTASLLTRTRPTRCFYSTLSPTAAAPKLDYKFNKAKQSKQALASTGGLDATCVRRMHTVSRMRIAHPLHVQVMEQSWPETL